MWAHPGRGLPAASVNGGEQPLLKRKHLSGAENGFPVAASQGNDFGAVAEVLVCGVLELLRPQASARALFGKMSDEGPFAEPALLLGHSLCSCFESRQRLLSAVSPGHLAPKALCFILAPPVLAAGRLPSSKQLFSGDMALHGARVERGRRRGRGAVVALRAQRFLNFRSPLRELFDQALVYADNFKNPSSPLDINAQALFQLRREFCPIDGAGNHFAFVDRPALDRARGTVFPRADIKNQGVGMKLWILGSRGSVFEGRYDETGRLALRPTPPPPGNGRRLFQVVQTGLDCGKMCLLNGLSGLRQRLAPKDGNGLRRREG